MDVELDLHCTVHISGRHTCIATKIRCHTRHEKLNNPIVAFNNSFPTCNARWTGLFNHTDVFKALLSMTSVFSGAEQEAKGQNYDISTRFTLLRNYEKLHGDGDHNHDREFGGTHHQCNAKSLFISHCQMTYSRFAENQITIASETGPA